MRLHSFALVSRLAPAASIAVFAAPILLEGCSSKWTAVDGDGDGVTLSQGDCNDGDGSIFPGATEAWYDGVDSDCSGGSDFDRDGDGFGAVGFTDEEGVEGTDCWDDPDSVPADFTASAGMGQLGAVDVHPGADDIWYDDIDANCDGASDFDQDGDGFDSELWPNSDGVFGDDCYDVADSGCVTYDGTEADCSYPVSGPLQGDPIDPYDIHPTAADTWYDGTDQDCGGNNDFDQDNDGFASYEECDDTDPDIYPNPDIPEIWYNGYDENCDGNDADQDGDTYLDAGYAGGWSHDMSYYSVGDCWDDPAEIPDWVPVNGFPVLSADEVNPGADETWYDGLDQDCAGNDDFDQDADGYDVDTYRNASGQYGDDCDDLAGDTNPGAVDAWYDGIDADCAGNNDFDQDGDGYGQNGSGLGVDCDDTDRLVSPAGTETCATAYDDDCDGDTNDLNAVSCTVRYYDGDRDTYGTTSSECRCAAAGDFDSSVATDCDDASSTDHPGATETVGNQDDEDCNGGEICFDDTDNDGYLDGSGRTRVSADTDCADANEGTNTDPTTDCDDTNPSAHPGATEVTGDGIDEDCNSGEICYDDDDNDGYLDTTGDTRVSADADCADANEGTNTDPTTDCDDANISAHPGAFEVVGDGVDEDCDSDEICYNDDDNDGYLDTSGDTIVSANTSCGDAYEGTNTDPTTDCDDANPAAYPGATEVVGDQIDESCDGGEVCYNDDDNDGYLDTSADTIVSVDADCADAYEGTNADATTDCDDANSAAYPGAFEVVGDGIDESCDGGEICYDDDDNDGYLDTTADVRISADADCADANEGTNTDATTDCDDSNASAHPGATEVTGDGIDEDCNGGEICFDDDDNDGYLDTTADTRVSSDADCADSYEGTNTDVTTDCDDTNAAAHPGASEIVGDQIDESCDGGEICYNDDDNDNYLDATGDTIVSSDADCIDSYEGTNTDLTTDCDDANAGIHPGASEITGDSIDEDCNGGEICYDDDDNDGYLDATGDTRISADTDCADSYEGTNTDVTTDCDDTNAAAHPGASEITGDSIDENCDGGEVCFDDDDNDGYLDTTGDTRVSADTDCADSYEGTTSDPTTDCADTVATTHPGATETCNGVDDNCNSSIDDGLTLYYTDGDGDGNGAGTGSCSISSGITTSTDCDDADRYVYTGAPEICDNQYNNCTGSGSWTTASESGKVSVNNGSTWTDITSTFSGTSSSPGSRTLASGDTLYLCGSTTTYGRVSASGVDASITAMNGSPTLDGGSSASALSVNGGHVSVSNLTLRHGGGTAGYGGAVYAVASTAPSASTYTVSLTSTTVWAGAASYGGGIAVDDYASVKLSGATIQANTATQQGGGIWMDTNARLEAVTAVVTQNVAGTNGGGLYMAGGTLSTSGSIAFTSNTAATSGGGVYMAGGTATLTGSSVSAGNTFTGDVATSTNGGALYIAGGTWTSYYNAITGNSAGGDGGAVAIAGGTASLSSTSTVSTNVAGDDGGGYYQSGGTLNIGTSHTISNNDAGGIGGGAAFRGGTATFSAGTVISGNATTGTTGGGGIGVTNANVSLTTPSISMNDATGGDGGGIFVEGTGALTVSGGTLSGNGAAGYGGNVYIDTTTTALFTTSSSVGTTVTGGTAALNGGNFAIYGGAVTLTSTSVTSGLADSGGGLLIDAGSLTATNATFSNNTATVDGGGIYSNAGTISATGLTLSNNAATGDGGGAWLGAAAAIAGTISGNTALDGGGLYVGGGTTTLSGTTVSGNDADYGGGVAIDNSGALAMGTSSIESNTASVGAGVFNIGDLTCTGSSLFLYGIYDNLAVSDGGGVKMSTGASSFASTLCDFGTAAVVSPPAAAVHENFADGSSNDISLHDGTVVLYGNDATFTCSGTACTP